MLNKVDITQLLAHLAAGAVTHSTFTQTLYQLLTHDGFSHAAVNLAITPARLQVLEQLCTNLWY